MSATIYHGPISKVLLDLEAEGANEQEKEAVRYLMIENAYTAARLFDNGGYAVVAPLMFTHAIISGNIIDLGKGTYSDRWCYETEEDAMAALKAWNGEGEPEGWHRHPNTGRRRPDKTAASEYVAA